MTSSTFSRRTAWPVVLASGLWLVGCAQTPPYERPGMDIPAAYKEQAAAQANLECMIGRYDRHVHRWRTLGFRVDHAIVAKATLARCLWVQGLPDTAEGVLKAALADAQAYGHSLTTCYLLVEGAIPVALLRGDDPKALVALMIDIAIRNNYRIWEVCGRCFEEMLLVQGDGGVARLPLFKAAVQRLDATGFRTHIAFFSAVLAEGWRKAGDVQEGLSTIDAAIAVTESTGELWCLAELLRIRGDLLLASGDAGLADQGEVCLKRALDLSRSQGALSWALRAAHSLARSLAQRRRVPEAFAVLGDVCSRFREGTDSVDLVVARALLSELEGGSS